MPKNTQGGNKFKKTKNCRPKKTKNTSYIDVNDGTGYYAKVTKKYGNNRVGVKLNNGIESHAIIPGLFRKKVWIDVDHIVLINTDFEILKLIKEDDPEYQNAVNMFKTVDDTTFQLKTDVDIDELEGGNQSFGNSLMTSYNNEIDLDDI